MIDDVPPEATPVTAPDLEWLRECTRRLPREPGVYVFKDARGRILYIGKAKDLRARVQTYLPEGGDGRPLVPALQAASRDLDYIVTPDEFEALLLENSMIKKERPTYNIRLRDDKSYVSVRYDLREPYGRLEVTRKIRKDGARYLGPFLSAGSVRATLRLILPLHPLRLCSDHVFNNRVRPCVYYQIGRCPAPCVGKISEADYRVNLEGAVRLLQGREGDLVDALRDRMWKASESENFEVAARIRDQIERVRRTAENARVVTDERRHADVFALVRDGERVAVNVLTVRAGRLMTTRPHVFRSPQDDAEVLTHFVVQFYGVEREIPPAVFVDRAIDDAASVEAWLRRRRERAVELREPQRGDGARLIAIARRNAGVALEQAALRGERDGAASVDALGRALGLARDPIRLEAYDISHTGGGQTVGVAVTFEHGEPEKSGYRKLRLRAATDGDDYAAMEEVLRRRFTRRLAEDEPMPDLVVIDGGRGQLNRALEVLREVGVEPEETVVCALAKGRTEDGKRIRPRDRREKVYLPDRDEPLLLPGDGAALALLDRLRDEAHRFAITYHRSLRSKARIGSALDDVPGVGPRTRKKLLTAFGSLDGLRGVPAQEIRDRAGVSAAVARAVADRFGEKD